MADDNPTPPAAGATPVAPAASQTAVPPVPTPKAPEMFSREYVTELREENRGWRLKADEQTQRARAAEEGAKKVRAEAEAAAAATRTEAETAVANAKAEAEAASAAAEKAANERVIRAELRTAAIRAGMIDLDGLKLADVSGLTLGETGEVEGAEALMEALKAAKPYLFGQAPAPTGNTNPAPPPPPKPAAGRQAAELSDEEWRAHLARIHAGQGIPR